MEYLLPVNEVWGEIRKKIVVLPESEYQTLLSGGDVETDVLYIRLAGE